MKDGGTDGRGGRSQSHDLYRDWCRRIRKSESGGTEVGKDQKNGDMQPQSAQSGKMTDNQSV
ncbi:hypothetical protein BKI51_22615 [Alphaproteobacteria bacterium AO1-B]|nr:hypothetical protein BKI51_22615 [Alphaproteobacteria bacterium AO1-B]